MRVLLGAVALLAIHNLNEAEAMAVEAPTKACTAQLHGDINTPADDAVHCAVAPTTCTKGVCQCDPTHQSPYDIEWWYWSGHLQTLGGGHKFGFTEIIYSAIDLESVLPLTWVDSTLTDVGEGKYRYGGRETIIGMPDRAKDHFQFSFPLPTVSGGNGFDLIQSKIVDQETGKTYEVNLALLSVKSPVQQRADGLVNYYSRERMLAVGDIILDGRKQGVVGTLWFDHQFGPQRDAYQNVKTWQWFALQLRGNRELVVYDVEVNANETRPEYANGIIEGTYSDPLCNVKHLTRQDFTITPLGTWQSKWMPPGWGDFKCIYPMGWRIQVPSEGIDVEVQPYFSAQEIVVPEVPNVPLVGDRYWEGDAAVTGSDAGEAYVELTGYCPFAPGPL